MSQLAKNCRRQRLVKSYKRGEAHHRATATDEDVAMAIELVEVHGLSCAEVARKFEVSRRAVNDWVLRARRWKR